MTRIYLDNNSTTSLLPEVAAAMVEAYQTFPANPASQHQPGQQARAALEDAREGIASLLGLREGHRGDRLVFTSGGTEANNLILFGRCHPPGKLLMSSIEHPSCTAAAEQLERHGVQVEFIRVDRQGVVDLADLSERLESSERPQLVSVMLGNNETGVLQPLKEIVAACQERLVPVHSDAVQVAGRLPIDFQHLGLSAMSISAHKFHGPPGVGALIVRNDVELHAQQFGGGQQAGLRPGTECVALAIGMHRALEIWHRESHVFERHMRKLRDHLEAQLVAAEPAIELHSQSVARLPQTTCASFIGVDRQALVLALDLAGIACSTGSACSSGSSEPSPVLRAMGLGEASIESAIRLSLSRLTSQTEVDSAVECILSVYRDLRQQSERPKTAWSPRQRTPETL